MIDGLLGNDDRNNGNWGLIVGTNGTRIAPIFDNGASFYPKKSEESIQRAIKMREEERVVRELNVITPFTLDGIHHLNYTSILSLTNKDVPLNEYETMRRSIKKIADLVSAHIDEIRKLFDSIPETYQGIEIITPNRKKYYLESFLARYQRILLPLVK